VSEPTTAVAAPEAVGQLPAHLAAALESRKVANLVAAKLAEQNWGKALDQATRRAVAEWGQRHRVDVTTEIDVLGGRIYLNAAFYLRKLGELVEAGVVEYAVPDYVHADKRLQEVGTPEANAEHERRLMERIRWGVPEGAAAACVFRVKLRKLDKEIVGVNWCGGGVRKGDPVGDAEPTKTAASRAARRALRQLVSHVRQEAERITRAEADAVEIGVVIEEETAKTDLLAAENAKVGRQGLALKSGEDAYAEPGDAA
jgi:hypothetical protein